MIEDCGSWERSRPIWCRPLCGHKTVGAARGIFQLTPNGESCILQYISPRNVYFLLELAVSPGRFEDLKALMPERVEANRKEVGMLT